MTGLKELSQIEVTDLYIFSHTSINWDGETIVYII